MFKYDFQDDSNKTSSKTLLEPGICNFVVKFATTKDRMGLELMSSNNEPKLKVDLLVTDSKGDTAWCSEHITAKNGWRLGRLLKAIGKADLYNAEGMLDPKELLGGTGKCVIKRRPPQNGFDAQNAIEGYVDAMEELPPPPAPAVEQTVAAPSFPEEDPLDQDIPF